MKRGWFVVLGLVAGLGMASGSTPSGLVRDGNEAFELGSFDEALSLYRKAAKERPDSAEIAYNQGAALYKKNDFSGATRYFEEAAQGSGEVDLKAKAEFNLGNCRFREAEQAKEQGDLKGSIQSTRQSAGHFREALRLEPDHREAAENLEMARLYLKTLLEEQQQQPQDQQDQQDGDDKEESQEQQQQQAGEQRGEQGEEKEGAQQQAGEQEQPEGEKEGKEQAGEKQEPEEKQAGAEGEEKKEEKEQQQAAKEEEGKDGKDAEEIDEAARDILEEEKENQERRRMRVPVGLRPVDKDW